MSKKNKKSQRNQQRNAARLRSEGFVCLVPHERSVAMAFDWDTGTPTTPVGIFDMDYDELRRRSAEASLYPR